MQDITVGYVRLSMLGEDRTSIDRQESLVKEFAAQTKTQLMLFTEPEGHRSGRSEKNRPKFKAMKEYLSGNAARIKFLWVQDSDRISRKAVTRLQFLEWLKDLNVALVSHLEPHLQSVAMPKSARNFMDIMSAGASQHYADFISEKMLNHVTWVKANGGVWGVPPRGLRPEGKGPGRRYVRGREDDLDALVKLSQIYLDAYIGVEKAAVRGRDLGLKVSDKQGNIRLVRPIDLRTFLDKLHYYDGILDPVLLARLRERIAERANHAQNGKHMKHPSPILFHLVFCVHCGARYWVKSSVPAREKGKCKADGDDGFRMLFRHPVDNGACKYDGRVFGMRGIEEQVWNHLAEYFILSDEQKHEIATYSALPQVSTTALRRKELQSRLDRLEVMFLDRDNIDGALLTKERYLVLRAEIRKDLDELPKEPTSSVSPMTMEDALDRLGAVVQLIRDHADKDTSEVNIVMRAILEKIMVDGNQVVRYVPRAWCAALFPKGDVRQ